MNDKQGQSMREYGGMIWIADQPAIRSRSAATSLEEARARVIAEYGDDHVIIPWNEDDAASPR